MDANNDQSEAIGLGLRIAIAATACLVVSETWQLGQRSLSVYSAHLAMVTFPHTAFQKVFERISGRVLGVLVGLLLVIFFHEAPLLLVLLMIVGQMAFFYVNASGRLAYAALMGGLFLGVVVEIGLGSSAAAESYAVDLVEQLVLAGVMTIVVNWTTGAERDITIDTTGPAPLTLRRDWVSKAALVSTAQVLALFVANNFDLPPLPTMVSATILGLSTSDTVAMGQKAYQRALGVVLGGGYALIAMVVLAYIPSFVLLAALVFYAMFLAGYFTKASVKYSYAFLQMGLVLPMVLIGSSGEIGSMATAIQRLIGVAAGLAVAETVFVCWPKSTLVPATA